MLLHPTAPGPVPADPLDELDAKLDVAPGGDAGTASKPASAREALAAGFARLVGPLVGAARRDREAAQWGLKLSARGMGTPRSWAEDSGACGGQGWLAEACRWRLQRCMRAVHGRAKRKGS